MNQSFLELQAKEKLATFRREGQRSQAFHRSNMGRTSFGRPLRYMAIAVASILSIILIIAR